MSNLDQADKDAMLVAEAAALGVMRPQVWDAFMQGWEDDVIKRINERFPTNLSGGSVGEGSGGFADVDDGASDPTD